MVLQSGKAISTKCNMKNCYPIAAAIAIYLREGKAEIKLYYISRLKISLIIMEKHKFLRTEDKIYAEVG